MDAGKYQEFTRTTAIYPRETALSYLCLGLASEAGEVCDKLKKHIRDSTQEDLTPEQITAISKELGDVLWYVARLADELGLTLPEVIEANHTKLLKRKQNQTLKGSGDDR